LFVCFIASIPDFVRNGLSKALEISKGIRNSFISINKRWTIERTFAWFDGYRRLAKCFEKVISSAKSFIMIAHSMTLMRRTYIS
jgi:hypothetical protein